jgi:hypothetical protein
MKGEKLMACDICKYGPLCAKRNPSPDLKFYFNWAKEARNKFIEDVYPFLRSAIIESGEGINLFGKRLSISDLIRWEQGRSGFDKCFKSNSIITHSADSFLIDCV